MHFHPSRPLCPPHPVFGHVHSRPVIRLCWCFVTFPFTFFRFVSRFLCLEWWSFWNLLIALTYSLRVWTVKACFFFLSSSLHVVFVPLHSPFFSFFLLFLPFIPTPLSLHLRALSAIFACVRCITMSKRTGLLHGCSIVANFTTVNYYCMSDRVIFETCYRITSRPIQVEITNWGFERVNWAIEILESYNSLNVS